MNVNFNMKKQAKLRSERHQQKVTLCTKSSMETMKTFLGSLATTHPRMRGTEKPEELFLQENYNMYPSPNATVKGNILLDLVINRLLSSNK